MWVFPKSTQLPHALLFLRRWNEVEMRYRTRDFVRTLSGRYYFMISDDNKEALCAPCLLDRYSSQSQLWLRVVTQIQIKTTTIQSKTLIHKYKQFLQHSANFHNSIQFNSKLITFNLTYKLSQAIQACRQL